MLHTIVSAIMMDMETKNKGVAWVVMGVCGCGKSALGAQLAARLGVAFIEGDDFHSEANVAKMRAGTALTDGDREGWLRALRAELAAAGDKGIVLSCSALKRAYRDVLRGEGAQGPDVRFVHLDGERALLDARVRARPGHYMPASLLDSQLQTLERLQPDEAGITLDIRAPLDELLAQVLARAGA